MSQRRTLFLISCVIVLSFFILWSFIYKPQNEREWVTEQKTRPVIEMNNDIISISDIRNFSYEFGRVNIDYIDKSFSINDIESVDMVIVPFNEWPMYSHIFLSFKINGLVNNITVSVEGRLEKGEKYNFLGGFMRQYELTYIIADERDKFTIYSEYLAKKIYLIPLKLSSTETQKLFVNVLKKAQDVYEKPKFYNIITNSCGRETLNELREIVNWPDKRYKRFNGFTTESVIKYLYEINVVSNDINLTNYKSFPLNESVSDLSKSATFSTDLRKKYLLE